MGVPRPNAIVFATKFAFSLGVIACLFISSPQSGFAKTSVKNKKVEKPAPVQSLREFAEGQLSAEQIEKQVEQSAAKKTNKKTNNTSNVEVSRSTPSIMLPLQENYQALNARNWDWVAGLALSQRRYSLSRPDRTLGPATTQDFGNLNYLEVQGGLEKAISPVTLGVSVLGAYAQTRESRANGNFSYPLLARFVSYGVEPKIRFYLSDVYKAWQPELGLALSQITFTQSSTETELAEWSRSFSEKALRASLGYAINEQSRVLLSLRRHWTDEESFWNLSLGGSIRW